MREYVAAAVILDREAFREYDSRVTFFTEKFGKLTGRATSARKIKSKLAPHLEPGNLVNLRFVEKKGLQITDSVKNGKSGAGAPDLYALSQILGEGEPDPELWALLQKSAWNWRAALKILGWSPAEASCFVCGGTPRGFHLPDQHMYCADCALKLRAGQVIYF